jgi:two-component system, cell cycle sensor histidine kinase and response regulator CckA
MSAVLNVLVVEDSEDDTILLVHELMRGGYDPVFQRVETSETMRAAIERKYWDVIFSDHSMPQFSATEALSISRQSGMDVPFIVVSGRIGEEAAVEIMKAGANDYVRKDDLTRLLPALNRELQSAYDRVTRRRAEATMAHLASIVESCEDAIISETLDGTIVSWNSGAERIYGYRAEEMVGRSSSILLPADRADDLATEEFRRSEHPNRFETVRVRKDGQVIDVSVTVSQIKNAAGQVNAAAIVARDITQIKQQEAERLKLIQELSDALASVKTLSGLLPICSSCKKIRNDKGYWEQVEIYIRNRSNAEFTHGICPQCRQLLYAEYETGT